MPGRLLRQHQPSAAVSPVRLTSASIALGLLTAAATPCSQAWADPFTALQQRGFELSKVHCARCHIISEQDRFAGTSSTPSFKAMIQYLPDWEERFDTFMARNPHPAHIRLEGDEQRPENLPATIREVILSLDEIEAILAYVDRIATDLGEPQKP